MAIGITVTDNADGTGIVVAVTGSDPASTNTVQVFDLAMQVWRDTYTRTGDGNIQVYVGNLVTDINVDRTYLARIQSDDGVNPLAYSVEAAAQPTSGYPSPAFQLLMIAKRAILALNIPKIGGRVFHCIDPRGAIKVQNILPAIFVCVNNGTLPRSQDNMDTEIKIPIEVVFAENQDTDWVSGTEYWLTVPWIVFTRFHRVPIDIDNEQSNGGRKWEVTFGQMLSNFPEAYEYRTSSVTLWASVEKRIREF